MRIRGPWILGFLVVAVLVGLGAYAYHIATRVLVLRIASGPAGSFGNQFAVSVVHLVSLEHPRVKVRVTSLSSDSDALKALTNGEADLAISRADAASAVGQTIAVLRRDIGLFVLPHNSKIDSVAGLRGATIGVVGAFQDANGHLLETVLKAYGLPDKPDFVPLAENAVAQALRGKKVTAIFVVGSPGGRTITRTLAAVRSAGGGQPHIVVVDEADAIAKRNQILESVDVSKGALQGQPALPDDDTSTIGVSTRLFATPNMPNAVAAEITRMLLADKPRVASLLPSSALIEAPDTDSLNASLPIHPGASAYLSGNQPSVSDEAQNALYWIGIIASILASSAAALTALFRRFAPKRPEATLKLLDLWVAAPAASKTELAEIDAKVDAVVQEMVKKQVTGKGEEVSAALPLIVNEVKRAIDRRKHELT
jgi:TRAP-type uncharacterized transport system substrate-binding protein